MIMRRMERQRNQHPGAEFDHFAYSTTKIAPGGKMPAADKQAPVTIQELLVSSLAQTDALAKLLIEKGIIMQPEFMAKIAQERATYQRMLNLTRPVMQRLLMKFPLVVILSSAVCFAGDYEDGTAAFDRGDYAIALKKLHPLAEQGNALAQNSLGVMYVEGKGVSQDYDEAIRWFRKAADQGLAKAQTNLGWMYVEGESVSQDYAEAAKWFRKAADQGFAVAQYNLGGMYGRGEGVPRDFVLAFMWFSLAEKNGFQPASQLRESAEAFLTPSQIVEAQKRVSEWKNSERQPTP